MTLSARADENVESCRPIALVGFMGCGKTSVGKILAGRLGLGLLDLDEEIERHEGQTVSQLFAIRGEAWFRQRENEALDRCSKAANLVVACGGGIVEHATNSSLLSESFTTVWLNVPLRELLRRLEGERAGRPLLSGGDWMRAAESLYSAREESYRQVASIEVRWADGEDADSLARRTLLALQTKSGRILQRLESTEIVSVSPVRPSL